MSTSQLAGTGPRIATRNVFAVVAEKDLSGVAHRSGPGNFPASLVRRRRRGLVSPGSYGIGRRLGSQAAGKESAAEDGGRRSPDSEETVLDVLQIANRKLTNSAAPDGTDQYSLIAKHPKTREKLDGPILDDTSQHSSCRVCPSAPILQKPSVHRPFFGPDGHCTAELEATSAISGTAVDRS